MLQRLCALLVAFLFVFVSRASAQQKVVTLYNNPSLVQVVSPTPVNSGTSIAATFSTTPTVGNLMVCALSSLSGSYAGPTGWKLYQSASNSGIQISAFYRIVQPDDTRGPYTFTDGNSTSLHLGCEEFANVDPISPFIASASAIGTLHGAGSILFGISRSTLSGSLPLIFSAMAGNASALQAGWTNDWDSASSNNAISGHAQRFTPMASGATWQPNVAYSAGGAYVILQLVLHTKLPPNSIVATPTGGTATIPVRAPIVAYVGGQYAWMPSDPSITQDYVDYPQMEPFSHQLPPYFGNIQCPVGSPCSPWAYLDTNTQNCTNDEIDWYNQANVPANENWFLHTDTPITAFNRVTSIASSPKCTGPDGNPNHAYYPNLLIPAARAAYVARYSNRISAPTGLSPVNQAIMADNNAPYCNKGIIYEYECPSSGSTVAAITTQRSAEADMIADFSPSRVMCNGLGPGGGFYGQGTGDGSTTTSLGGAFHYAIIWEPLYTPVNLLGCIHEGILRRSAESAFGPGEVNARIVINTVSQILNNSSKSVVLLDYSMNTDCTSNDQLRREHFALKMLVAGDKLDRVLDWEASYIPTTTCIAIFPEQQIYVKHPLKLFRAFQYNTAGSLTPELPFGNGSGCRNVAPSGSHAPDTIDTGGVDDVVVACPSGANNSGHGADTGGNPAAIYGREYDDCYYAGTRFGHCAVLFNSTAQPETIPVAGLVGSWTHYNYTHTIGWSGNVMSWACPISAACNGAINLNSGSVTMGTTQIPALDAMILSP